MSFVLCFIQQIFFIVRENAYTSDGLFYIVACYDKLCLYEVHILIKSLE